MHTPTDGPSGPGTDGAAPLSRDPPGFRGDAGGVEHALQAEWLKRHGCHQAQGYLYDRALPGDEFERRIAALQRV